MLASSHVSSNNSSNLLHPRPLINHLSATMHSIGDRQHYVYTSGNHVALHPVCCVKNPSQVSHPSQQMMPVSREEHETDQTGTLAAQEDTVAISKTIYRIRPHSDIFGCNNCRLTGDKWFMQEHRWQQF